MKNILLVEDNATVREPIALLLGRNMKNYRVITAANGQEGVDILKTTPIDFIITDLQMPVMNGYEFIDHINKNYPDVPVIAMTAEKTRDAQERLLELGVMRLIEKPFIVNEVTNNLSKILGDAPIAPAVPDKSGAVRPLP